MMHFVKKKPQNMKSSDRIETVFDSAVLYQLFKCPIEIAKRIFHYNIIFENLEQFPGKIRELTKKIVKLPKPCGNIHCHMVSDLTIFENLEKSGNILGIKDYIVSFLFLAIIFR